MIKKFLLFLAVAVATFILFEPSQANKEKLYYAAPALLPHTTREMKTPGFWISRHPDPDRIILTQEEIEKFNFAVQNDLQLTKDIRKLFLKVSAKEVKISLKTTLKDFLGKRLYLKDGRVAGRKFFKRIKEKMNIAGISQSWKPQGGFVVRFCDQRFLPTEEGLYVEPYDFEFDELQNSDLDLGTLVLVLHQSSDGGWYYVQSEISLGWVKKEDVALGDISDFNSTFKKQPIAVVVSPKADVYLNANLTEYYDYVRMGVQFPIENVAEDVLEIQAPARNPEGKLIFKRCFLKKEDARQGYLPYTPRQIITQAFKLLNEPYGWGGMHGEQDCSRFLQEIFATVGISLPRDSKDQAKVGVLLAGFNSRTTDAQKLKILENTVAGITVLPLKGHIMLYLGMADGRPYAIHAAWAYSQRNGMKDIVRVINRVVVSDLYLSEGTKKRSLLKRLQAVRVIWK